MVRKVTLKNLLHGMVLGTGFMFVASSLLAADVIDSSVGGDVMAGENEAGTVKFSVGVGAGYLTGESTELVYWPSAGNHKASELTWQIDSLYMVNVSAGLDIVEDWFVNVDGWFRLADGEGTMDDYDWVTVGGPWTDWSHHEDTDVTKASIIDISGGWRFMNNDDFSVSAIFGYKRENYNWEAYGGSYVYSSGGFRNLRGNFPEGEPGIGYDQTLWAVYLGLGFTLDFCEYFSFDGRVIYAPFVQADAEDHHYQRNLVTYDEFEDGDMYSVSLTASYHVTKNLDVDLGYSYTSYDEMQGDSDWESGGLIQSYPDGAGTSSFSSLLSLQVKYSF